jgi:hypothetical protein
MTPNPNQGSAHIPLTCPPYVSAEDQERLEREFTTYRRELPRLLSEGDAGRFAVIREDQVVSIWDTQRDAIQVARERFGLEPVTVKKIDPRDLERLAALDSGAAVSCLS